jgi:hypothetical protein
MRHLGSDKLDESGQYRFLFLRHVGSCICTLHKEEVAERKTLLFDDPTTACT